MYFHSPVAAKRRDARLDAGKNMRGMEMLNPECLQKMKITRGKMRPEKAA